MIWRVGFSFFLIILIIQAHADIRIDDITVAWSGDSSAPFKCKLTFKEKTMNCSLGKNGIRTDKVQQWGMFYILKLIDKNK